MTLYDALKQSAALTARATFDYQQTTFRLVPFDPPRMRGSTELYQWYRQLGTQVPDLLHVGTLEDLQGSWEHDVNGNAIDWQPG